MGSVLKLGLGVQSKVRIGPGLGVRAKVKVGPDFRAKTTSTQSGQDRQVPSTSHQGRLPPCWGPRLIHGGSASLEKEEGSNFWLLGHTHTHPHFLLQGIFPIQGSNRYLLQVSCIAG